MGRGTRTGRRFGLFILTMPDPPWDLSRRLLTDSRRCQIGERRRGSPTSTWGSVGAGDLVGLFRLSSSVLYASAETVDNTGNVAGTHIAWSSSQWHSATQHPDEATFDQLDCIQ
jgi:hypothetical protein